MTTANATPTLATVEGSVTRPWLRMGLAVLAGLVIAYAWSFHFVDSVIGDNVANTLLGYDARSTALTGLGMGAAFALVSGLAGTFTACNVAALSAVAPLARGQSQGSRLRAPLIALGWMMLGMCAVSAVYGFAGVLFADRLPQLSIAVTSGGMPVRLVQSSVVFGLIGAAFMYLALAALGKVPQPLSGLTHRFPPTQLLFVGALIGGFLIGRPFPLFRQMFTYAVEQHNPLYGAGVFVLQSLGNILVVAVLFIATVTLARGRIVDWLQRHPQRLATFAATGFMVAGSFTFIYWVVRVPAIFGYGWFPTAPWN